jgi:solute:Na+ symporter, SSS family
MHLIDLIVLVAYFTSMVAIGVWAMRRVKGQEDYFMGGRGFGKLLQTFAAFGAGTGAHEPITVGRTGWTSGLSGVWSALMWLFVTPMYWIVAVWYRRMRHITLGDWFVERYESRGLGLAYSIFAAVFYMFYLSTMFSAIAKFTVPLIGVEQLLGLDLQYVVIPGIALIVILYGVLGGLTAAYYTDLIQGVFIVLLSVLLIPFGLLALVKTYGNPDTMGIMDGFRILHERVAPDYFSLFGGPAAGEFPFTYIISLSILGLVGIVVQPHFIATGGGSAKTEDEARIGLVVGNFLKRLCTVGWALTALIALALLAGNAEIAADPDRVWGVAAREILGPLNLGLVGLMLACLMAAMMSSADTYMIVTSALFTRNVYAAFFDATASEKTYVFVARLTGLTIIVGAAVVALTMADVFGQFKLAVELPILFAAPFWAGMVWRRANPTAAWVTIVVSLLVFFLLPIGLPRAIPALRSNPLFTTSTQVITRTTTRIATAADVARHDAWRQVFSQATEAGDHKLIQSLGTSPPAARLGEPITIVTTTGGKSIFWTGGLTATGPTGLETVVGADTAQGQVLVQRKTGAFVGVGDFNLDFALYAVLGIDLSRVSKATLEALRLPARVLLPFLVLLVTGFLTPRQRHEVLDRYFAKMATAVAADPAEDRARLERAYAQPELLAAQRLFPDSDWEFRRPQPRDIWGFLISVGVCGGIIGLLVGLASIGAD